MNAHNEQLLISSLQAAATGNTTTLKMMELCGAAAKALSSNPTNQPAAAQEAVAWPNECSRTVPEALRFLANHERPSGGEDRFNSLHLIQLASEIERMASKPLYAAPVTAAPTLDDELAQDRMSELSKLERDVLDALPAVYYMDPPDGGDVSLGEQVKRMAEDAALWRKHISTPAAPGIDLARVQAALKYAEAAARHNTHTELAADFADLIRRIDASPKGDEAAPLHAHYCNAQPASAACICGLDSPKGGSEARDAALNTLAQMFHNSEEMEGPDGMVVSIDLSLWHEALEAYEVLIDGYDEVTLATSAQAQASDAEVRP